MAPENVNVYVKCEAFNPMGSVKDRLALGCIEVRGQRCIIVLGFYLLHDIDIVQSDFSHIHVLRYHSNIM